MKVLGYYIHKDDKEISSWTAMVIMDEVWSRRQELTGFCPQEGHFGTSKEYLDECISITKEDYLEASKQFHTPKEYLA
jgi:hypothetical protein